MLVTPGGVLIITSRRCYNNIETNNPTRKLTRGYNIITRETNNYHLARALPDDSRRLNVKNLNLNLANLNLIHKLSTISESSAIWVDGCGWCAMITESGMVPTGDDDATLRRMWRTVRGWGIYPL